MSHVLRMKLQSSGRGNWCVNSQTGHRDRGQSPATDPREHSPLGSTKEQGDTWRKPVSSAKRRGHDTPCKSVSLTLGSHTLPKTSPDVDYGPECENTIL